MLPAVHTGLACVSTIRKCANSLTFTLQGREVYSCLIHPGNPDRLLKASRLSLYSLKLYGSGRISYIALSSGFRNSVEENQSPHTAESICCFWFKKHSKLLLPERERGFCALCLWYKFLLQVYSCAHWKVCSVQPSRALKWRRHRSPSQQAGLHSKGCAHRGQRTAHVSSHA